MGHATDAEIELFHAFLCEDDPRVQNLLAHVLGIADDGFVDLVAVPDGDVIDAEALVSAPLA